MWTNALFLAVCLIAGRGTRLMGVPGFPGIPESASARPKPVVATAKWRWRCFAVSRLLATAEQSSDISFSVNPVTHVVTLELVAFSMIIGSFGDHAVTLLISDDHDLA